MYSSGCNVILSTLRTPINDPARLQLVNLGGGFAKLIFEHFPVSTALIAHGCTSTRKPIQPGQDARRLAAAYRLKGALLENMDRVGEAIDAYRAALRLDSKIGVKKRPTVMETAASERLPLNAPSVGGEEGKPVS